MTEWVAIEERFTRLRDFVVTDLEGFAEQEQGGNFALVALALAACDALGNLRYGSRGSGYKVLERCLPDEWKPVADILYDALRNGLIHGYDAKGVVDRGTTVGFVIGWRGESKHLQFLTEERSHLYIDGPSLVRSLRKAFADVEQELRQSTDLRDEFLTRDRKDRETHISTAQAERWREAVLRAQVCIEPWPPGGPAGATGPVGWTS